MHLSPAASPRRRNSTHDLIAGVGAEVQRADVLAGVQLDPAGVGCGLLAHGRPRSVALERRIHSSAGSMPLTMRSREFDTNVRPPLLAPPSERTCGFPQCRREISPAALSVDRSPRPPGTNTPTRFVPWPRRTPSSLRISAPTANGAPAFSPGEGLVLLAALADSEAMTSAPPIVEVADSAVDRAQLHLALASVSYMSGQVARSRAEAEAVLAEPGLPAALYAAAEQSHLLALLAEGSTGRAIGRPGDVGRARRPGGPGLARRLRRRDARNAVGGGLRRRGRSAAGVLPRLGLAAVYAGLGQFDDAQACVLAAADEIALGADPLWAAAPAVFSARIDLAAGRLDAARTAAQVGVETAGELGTPTLAPIGHDVLVDVGAVPRRVGRGRGSCARQWRSEPLAARLPFGTPNRHWAALRLREAQGIRSSATKRAAPRSTCSPPDRSLFLEQPAAAAWLVRVASPRRRSPACPRASCAPPSAWPPPTLATPPSPRQLPMPAGIAAGDPEPLARPPTAQRCPVGSGVGRRGLRRASRRNGETGPQRGHGWSGPPPDYLQCGATRDHARIRSRLRHLGVRRRHWSRQQRPVSGWDSLTETENTVAALVAEGLSNQQVASRMFLSRHTVDFHLRHIFRKLGIDSRVVLTRIALANAEQPS